MAADACRRCGREYPVVASPCPECGTDAVSVTGGFPPAGGNGNKAAASFRHGVAADLRFESSRLEPSEDLLTLYDLTDQRTEREARGEL